MSRSLVGVVLRVYWGVLVQRKITPLKYAVIQELDVDKVNGDA